MACAALATARSGEEKPPDVRLAEELLAEGNRQACRVECRRLLLTGLSSPRLVELSAASASRRAEPAQALPGRSCRSLLTAPARWAIAFYRRQISPAIGQRCSLEPSCSEYALQALRKHGLLGLAMYADRAVREPRVVAEQARPLTVKGRQKYGDPLEAHDDWLE